MENEPVSLHQIETYCLNKPGTFSQYPFGEGTLVFKVVSKMFALVNEDNRPLTMNLKCDPDDALALREQYPAIAPGYHMNKRHWITLTLDGNLPEKLIFELIDHSYELVAAKLTKTDRQKIRHWNIKR
jgi:predicted DNA-binding protein (MmcQ/YjbR family)